MTTAALAVVTGVVVLLAGSLPWAVLARLGGLGGETLSPAQTAPWVVLPMAAYLWGYWQVIAGRWFAADGGAERRALLRANPVSPGVWPLALASGLAGFATLLALLSLMARLVALPSGPAIATPTGMAVATVVGLLVMQSIVAGVTEEAAFRGYMQSLVERRHGLAAAILVNGLAFGLLHLGNHPRDVLLMLPYYLAVSAVYGGLTWAADSILPALVLHCVGDMVVLVRWWATGLPEWQLAAVPPPLLSESGLDASFITTAGLVALLGAVTTWGFVVVRRRSGRARGNVGA